VIILMELGVAEPVPAFNAPAVPHQLQQGFWRGSQAGEKEVPLEGRLSGTLAADDQFDDPAAAGPGLGDETRTLRGPECPGGVAPVTVLSSACGWCGSSRWRFPVSWGWSFLFRLTSVRPSSAD
jgi:hypothetical protein